MTIFDKLPVVDQRGARGTRASLGVQILSISCSFWENLAKLYVGAPAPRELAPAPRGNPGSSTGYHVVGHLGYQPLSEITKRLPWLYD